MRLQEVGDLQRPLAIGRGIGQKDVGTTVTALPIHLPTPPMAVDLECLNCNRCNRRSLCWPRLQSSPRCADCPRNKPMPYRRVDKEFACSRGRRMIGGPLKTRRVALLTGYRCFLGTHASG